MKLGETEQLDVQGAITRVAFLPIGGINIELVETSAVAGLVAGFLREKGEGIHHIAFEVDDIEKAFDVLGQIGVEFDWGK